MTWRNTINSFTPDPKSNRVEKPKYKGPKKAIRNLGYRKVYADEFGITVSELTELPCECGCGKMGGDIHHICAKGMGGDPKGKMDVIHNLMNLNNECHVRRCMGTGGMEHKPLRVQYAIHKKFFEECGKPTDGWPDDIKAWKENG